MKGDRRVIRVMATASEAILIPAFAVAVIGQWWLYTQGMEPPVTALAGAVLLSKPLALMIVMARDRRRQVAASVVLRHLSKIAYVFLFLFLLVILLWVIADRSHALPLGIGCVGTGSSLVLLVAVLHSVHGRA